MTRHVLRTAATIFATIAIIGGLFEFGHVWVCAWGIASAAALIGYGLTCAIADQPDDGLVPHSFAESWDSAAEAMTYDEPELPHRPVWPAENGSPE